MRNHLRALATGDPYALDSWIKDTKWSYIVTCLSCIFIGCGLYGLSVGLWRAPAMGAYVAIKFPLLLLFTLTINGLLNGILGLLLGSGLGFRQSILAQLMSFAIASLILGALSPVTTFFTLHAPHPESTSAGNAHSAYLLAHTLLIAYAGILANLQLFRLLVISTPTKKIAITTLLTWLSGNAFVGSQLSWILRPFFGSPNLEVAFLRPDPFNGTFIESVWRALTHLFSQEFAFALLSLLVAIGAYAINAIIKKSLSS